MNKNLKHAFKFHDNDFISLHTVIKKSVLPKEYGGTDSNINDIAEKWKNAIFH